MSPVLSRRDVTSRVVSACAGALLVAAFVAWLAMRQHDAMQSVVGMDTALGWVTQIGAYLILMAGVALLARGVFGRSEKESSS